MVITTTAVGFLLLAIGKATCGFRFLDTVYKSGEIRRGSKIGIMLGIFFLLFAIDDNIIAFASFYFAEYPALFIILLTISYFFLSAVAALGIYLNFYILFPKTNPWPATIATLIFGLYVVFVSTIYPQHPFLNSKGGIDFDIPRPLAILIFCLLFIAIGSTFSIFARTFVYAKSLDVKVTSAVLAFLASVGVINVGFRFVVFSITGDVRIQIFDAGVGFIGMSFILASLLLPAIIIKLKR